MSWDRLGTTYRRKGLVLVLGAGVSKGSRLPNWQGLLQSLVATSIDKGELVASSIGSSDYRLFNRLCHHDIPLAVIGSVIQQRCKPRHPHWDQGKEFTERVREALYQDFCLPLKINMRWGSGGEESRSKLVHDVRKNNETLRAIAGLCVVRDESDLSYKANDKIRAIVTFNLDHLFQSYVRARYATTNFLRTIERAAAAPKPRRPLHIYHMHGLLRFDNNAGNPIKESNEVVLTEQDYFDFFNDPTSLFNATFLYLIREFSCLFVGLSMQDENIRRLLHYSKIEREASLLEQGVSKSLAIEKSIRHFAILPKSGLAPVDLAKEQSLRALGTRVLWIDEYSQIRAELEKMYIEAGGNWDHMQ